MTLLDSWTAGEHTFEGTTHPTYRKGSGPGVVVIHEIPGVTPNVRAYSRLNCDALSYPTSKATVRALSAPAASRRRASKRRSRL